MMRRARIVAPTLLAAACANGPPGDSAESSSATVDPRPDSVVAPAPDERLLDSTIDRPIVIYVQATADEIQAIRDRYSEEDFAIVADDLMFYRATALEHLENEGYALVRIEGRRPLRFRVAGSPRPLDLDEVELLDFIVLYEPDREPRVIAPIDVHAAAEYFGGGPP